MANAASTVQTISIVALAATVFVAARFNRSIPSFLAVITGSVLLIPSPIFAGTTGQQTLYAGDMAILIAIIRRIFGVSGFSPEKYITTTEGASMGMFLVAIPLLSTFFQVGFATEISPVHTFVSLARMIGAYFLFLTFMHDVANGILRPRRAILTGLVGFSIYLLGIGAHYAGLISTDTLLEINSKDSEESYVEWNNGLGGGVMGLYRGEVGGFNATAFGLLFGVLLTARFGSLAAFAIALGCFLPAAAVGSRQGMIGIMLAFLVILVSNFLRGRSAAIKAKTVFIGIAAIVSAFLYISSNDILLNWLDVRFSVFSSADEGIQAVAHRDERMLDIVEKQFSTPQILLFGSGVGNISPYIESDPWIMTYVDSELLWTLQQSGLIGILCYAIALLVPLAFAFGKKSYFVEPEELSSLRAGLLVSIFFLYGHFVIAYWQSAHAAAGTLICFILGSIGGYRQIQLRWLVSKQNHTC